MQADPDTHDAWLASLAMLDTLRYRVHAHTTLPGQPQRIGITAEILLPPAGELAGESLHAGLRRVLARFMPLNWCIFLERRVHQTDGHESLTYRASAPLGGLALPQNAVPELAARARRAGTENVRLSAPQVSVEIDLVCYREVLRSLARETRETVKDHLAALYARSGRVWQVQSLEAAKDTPPGPDAPLEWQEGETRGQEIVLVTEIVLSAPPPTLH